MLWVTFHGGKKAVNNIAAYHEDGTLCAEAVLKNPPDMSELRAAKLVSDSVLWVLSGSARESHILPFVRTGSGNDSFTYAGQPVAEYEAGSALLHPFDFVFDSDGTCYVSNQDTNVVARFDVAAGFLSATPAPCPAALHGKGTFWPGTFVASADDTVPRSDPDGQHASAVPVPAGLEDSPPCTPGDCKELSKSVRGLAWANDTLYVADEVAAVVKIYDADGNYMGESNVLPSEPTATAATPAGPVHLLLADLNGNQSLVATNGQNVYLAPVDPAHPEILDLQPISTIHVPMVSGLTLTPDGVLYAASRTHTARAGLNNNSARIFKYANFPSDPTPDGSFPVNVDDLPEFVLYVPDTA